MSDDDNEPPPAASAAQTLEKVAAQLAPKPRVNGSLYRVVETMRETDGRLSRVGRIWHTDLAQVRRFGHALAANSTAQQVQVADASGLVLETIATPPPEAPSPGWGDWKSLPLPPAPPRPARPALRRPAAATRTAAAPPPPTMVPPIITQTLTPAAARLPPASPADMPPESEVERTATLPPI